jgi:uncharacterized alkaline shock family protein YloU
MDMADNSSPEVKLNDNPAGTVSFATEVVATIAGLAANEVEGVASMTSSNSALADILTRKSSRNFTKGVKVDIDDNQVTVDVTIVVEYGSPVPDVARSIQENVKKAIETMSGLGVRNVDVHVQGVSFERENKAAAELSEQQKKLLKKSGEDQPTEEKAELPEEDDLAFNDDLPEVDEEPKEDSSL